MYDRVGNCGIWQGFLCMTVWVIVAHSSVFLCMTVWLIVAHSSVFYV